MSFLDRWLPPKKEAPLDSVKSTGSASLEQAKDSEDFDKYRAQAVEPGQKWIKNKGEASFRIKTVLGDDDDSLVTVYERRSDGEEGGEMSLTLLDLQKKLVDGDYAMMEAKPVVVPPKETPEKLPDSAAAVPEEALPVGGRIEPASRVETAAPEARPVATGETDVTGEVTHSELTEEREQLTNEIVDILEQADQAKVAIDELLKEADALLNEHPSEALEEAVKEIIANTEQTIRTINTEADKDEAFDVLENAQAIVTAKTQIQSDLFRHLADMTHYQDTLKEAIRMAQVKPLAPVVDIKDARAAKKNKDSDKRGADETEAEEEAFDGEDGEKELQDLLAKEDGAKIIEDLKKIIRGEWGLWEAEVDAEVKKTGQPISREDERSAWDKIVRPAVEVAVAPHLANKIGRPAKACRALFRALDETMRKSAARDKGNKKP